MAWSAICNYNAIVTAQIAENRLMIMPYADGTKSKMRARAAIPLNNTCEIAREFANSAAAALMAEFNRIRDPDLF
jgi:hypothetical protein